MEKFRPLLWFSVLTDHCDSAKVLTLLLDTVTCPEKPQGTMFTLTTASFGDQFWEMVGE